MQYKFKRTTVVCAKCKAVTVVEHDCLSEAQVKKMHKCPPKRKQGVK